MTCSWKWIAGHQNLGWSVNYWWSVCSASQFKYYPTIFFLVEITFLKIPHLTIKGSKMCPFGSMFIKEEKKLPDDFDLHGYDPNEPDSDDEPLSDLEIELWPFLICELYRCLNGRTYFCQVFRCVDFDKLALKIYIFFKFTLFFLLIRDFTFIANASTLIGTY